MAKGDCIYIDAVFLKVGDPPKVFQSSGDCKDCCFYIPVFWSDDNDEKHHDYSSWPFFYDKPSTDTVELFLEKIEGSFVEKDSLNNTDYGVFYPLGFIDNRLDQVAIGYELDWNLVYAEFGNGQYRIKAVQTDIMGAERVEYSPEYELRKYVDELADETIRTEFTLNGEIGWFGEGKVDFLGVDFYMQFRIPNARFGYWNDTVEQENRRFQNGSTMPISHQIVDNYKIEIINAPEFFHRILQVTSRQAIPNTMTDYANCAKGMYDVKRVIYQSGMDATHLKGTDRLTVSYELEEYLKNKIIYK
jgi:hypothetical protein